MKTAYVYTLPNGINAVRKSERAYTHVVIGRINLVLRRECAKRSHPQHIKDFNFYKKYAETPAGQTWCDKSWCIVNEAEKAKYAELIAGYATAADYADKQVQASLDRIGDSDAGEWMVLQWSMSAANAGKSLGQWRNWHVEVSVQPVAA